MATGLNQVPGGARVVRVTGPRGTSLWLVYDVPKSRNGAIMAWDFSTGTQTQAILGDNPSSKVDETVDEADWHRRVGGGALWFGDVDDLANRSEHPFEGFLADYEKEAEIRPWLKDPEILTLTAQAILEGREVTDAEVKTTDWWRSRTREERSWLDLVSSDPSAARRRLGDMRRQVGEQLRQAGVGNAPKGVVRLIADNVAKGVWSESFAAEQVRKLSDPAAPGKLHADIRKAVKGVELDTTRARVEDVRGRAREWLGPLYGEWDEGQLEKWAGRLRNDPDAEAALMDHLRATRIRVFDQWTDPNLSYEDIAQPARTLFRQVWGQSADETDRFFVNVANTRDHVEAAGLLRKEGIKRGVEQVSNDAKEGLLGILGQPRGVI